MVLAPEIDVIIILNGLDEILIGKSILQIISVDLLTLGTCQDCSKVLPSILKIRLISDMRLYSNTLMRQYLYRVHQQHFAYISAF